MVISGRYDLIYCDQADVHIGAFFASIMRKKVVLRMYGVGSNLKVMENFEKRPALSLRYPSFFAPFSYVICTNAGTGERYFLSNYIRRGVPYEILLNGIKVPDVTYDKETFLKK